MVGMTAEIVAQTGLTFPADVTNETATRRPWPDRDSGPSIGVSVARAIVADLTRHDR